jgi:hypothetical protein
VFLSLLWTAFLWAVLLSLPENMTSTRTANLRLGSFNVGVEQTTATNYLAADFQQPHSDTAASSHAIAGATEHAVIQMPTLQCAVCERNLCEGADLVFFRRVNSMNGTEVHLMLRPEVPVPETFKPSADIEKGALQTWLCECGTKLGDTRPIAVRHAPMTAFKSAAVILGGQRFPGKKSKWPTVYNTPPFNQIEVRERDTYLGIQQ